MAECHKRRVVAHLDVLSFGRDAGPEDPAPNRCPACGSPLDVHQPDPDSPDRMLGVCLECSRWHIILAETRLGITIVTLPLVAPVLESWGSRDGEG